MAPGPDRHPSPPSAPTTPASATNPTLPGPSAPVAISATCAAPAEPRTADLPDHGPPFPADPVVPDPLAPNAEAWPASPEGEAAVSPFAGLPTGRVVRASVTVGGHTLVDILSFVITPLIPLLATTLALTDGQIAVLLATGSVCSGAIQPLVAWLCDRFHTRVFGTIGFAVAVLAISMTGFAENFAQLMLIQVIGTAGIGAFHPPAAAAVGRLAGPRRTQWISAFFLAGMFGGILGNVFSPWFVGRFGLTALAFLLIPGVLAVAAVAWALHKAPHNAHDAHAQRAQWTPAEARARWGAVWLLYVGNIVRFTVNMALVYLYQHWARLYVASMAEASAMTDALGQSASELNGPLQAAMQIGMGAAGLAAGLFVSVRYEKPALIITPLLGAAAIAAFPWVDTLGTEAVLLAFPLAVVAGVGFGGLIPVTMAIAQRLLPHRTGLASGLMLGGAWCFASLGPIAAERIEASAGMRTAFFAVAVALVGSALLSMLLPRDLLRRSAEAR